MERLPIILFLGLTNPLSSPSFNSESFYHYSSGIPVATLDGNSLASSIGNSLASSLASSIGNSLASSAARPAASPVINDTCDCGRANVVGRIYRGTKVPPHKYPWMVHLRIFRSFTSSQCGGTLIDNWHVLAAAHCVYPEGQRISPSSIVVYLGAVSLNDPYATIVRGSAIYTFGDYLPSNPLVNDIAIIRLSSPVQYSDKIGPICFPATDEEPYVNQKLTVAGWGVLDSRNTRTTDLNEARVDYLPRSECLRKRDAYAARDGEIPNFLMPFVSKVVPLPETDMCAIDRTSGGDACAGDSGGPLKYNNPRNNRWYQVGIVSGAWDSCGKSKEIPGLYTQVKSYREFIRRHSNACFRSY